MTAAAFDPLEFQYHDPRGPDRGRAALGEFQPKPDITATVAEILKHHGLESPSLQRSDLPLQMAIAAAYNRSEDVEALRPR